MRTMKMENGETIDIDTGDIIEAPHTMLRAYQEEAVERARVSIRAGHKRPLLVLPTGAGKSVIYAKIIYLARENGKKSLFLVHRRNLVKQFAETLQRGFGITSGVIMAGEEFEQGRDVYVSTVQTYHRRLQLEDDSRFNQFFVDADIVLTDEAHTTVSKRYQDIFKAYSGKIIIGTTATPARADGRGLGEVYDDLLDIIDVGKLTGKGYLCPIRYYAPTEIDLSKIKIKLGDYEAKELGNAVDTPKLIGDVVQNWLALAENRKTIVFAVNVKHSIHLRDEFIKNGIPAAHLDAHSTDEEREAVFRDMDDGRTTVICNVALYVEGMDVPDISCVAMARPTKSLGLYRQCVGRGLRISPGKKDLVLLDFGGVIDEHGYVSDEIEWSLDGKNKAWKKKEPKDKVKKPMKCPACHAVVEGEKNCPDCGTEMKSFGKKIAAVDADLVEHKKISMTAIEKRRWYGMCKFYAESKGYQEGWISHKYKEKVGCWPKGLKDTSPIAPDQNFKNWLTHINIKRAKSRAAA